MDVRTGQWFRQEGKILGGGARWEEVGLTRRASDAWHALDTECRRSQWKVCSRRRLRKIPSATSCRRIWKGMNGQQEEHLKLFGVEIESLSLKGAVATLLLTANKFTVNPENYQLLQLSCGTRCSDVICLNLQKASTNFLYKESAYQISLCARPPPSIPFLDVFKFIWGSRAVACSNVYVHGGRGFNQRLWKSISSKSRSVSQFHMSP